MIPSETNSQNAEEDGAINLWDLSQKSIIISKNKDIHDTSK